MDFLDYYRGRISIRKLATLIDHLPGESATVTAIRNQMTREGTMDDLPAGDPAEGQWSKDQMLTATLIDELRALRHAYATVHSPKGAAPKPPQPLRRPGAVAQTRKSRLTMAQRRMLDPRMRGGDDDA